MAGPVALSTTDDWLVAIKSSDVEARRKHVKFRPLARPNMARNVGGHLKSRLSGTPNIGSSHNVVSGKNKHKMWETVRGVQPLITESLTRPAGPYAVYLAC